MNKQVKQKLIEFTKQDVRCFKKVKQVPMRLKKHECINTRRVCITADGVKDATQLIGDLANFDSITAGPSNECTHLIWESNMTSTARNVVLFWVQDLNTKQIYAAY